MVNEADRFASEDKAKREAVETKNNAESLVYQTEKQIKELGDKVGRRRLGRGGCMCGWQSRHQLADTTAATHMCRKGFMRCWHCKWRPVVSAAGGECSLTVCNSVVHINRCLVF